MDTNRLAKYFTPKPALKPIVILGVVGLLLFPFGIVLWLVAGWKARGLWGRATEAEIDAYVSEEILPRQRDRALKQLGVKWEDVSAAKPIEVWCYSINDVLHHAPKYFVGFLGADEFWRAPEIEFNSFYFTENTVLHCKWVLSLIYGTENISTNEISLSDIVSVSRDTQDVGRDGFHIEVGTFTIRTTGGEAITCASADNDVLDEAVASLRSLVKARKG